MLSSILSAAAVTSHAQRVYVSVRPTAPAVVRPAAPRADYVWVDGEWVGSGRNYVYREGYWAAPKKGFKWVPGHWADRRGRGSYWIPGHWSKF